MLTITIWYSSKNRSGTSLEERKIKNSIQEGLAPRRSRRDLWIFGEAGALGSAMSRLLLILCTQMSLHITRCCTVIVFISVLEFVFPPVSVSVFIFVFVCLIG